MQQLFVKPNTKIIQIDDLFVDIYFFFIKIFILYKAKYNKMNKKRTLASAIILLTFVVLASYISRVAKITSQRGKVVTTKQSNNKSEEIQIIKASLAMVSFQADSTDVLEGDVCILDGDNNSTGDRIPFVPRKFPKWFVIAQDCDKEGDWVEYKLVANGKQAVITAFQKRNP